MHSCTSGECKTSCIQANRKICGPLLPLHGCPLHSCTEPCSLEEMPSSWLLPGEGKRRLDHISNVLTFWVTLPKRVGPDFENCWDLAHSRYLETSENKRELSDTLLFLKTHGTADRYQRQQKITSSFRKKKVPLLNTYTHKPKNYISRKKVERLPESLARLIGESLSQFLKTWLLVSLFKCTDNNIKLNEYTNLYTKQGQMAQRNKHLQKLTL